MRAEQILPKDTKKNLVFREICNYQLSVRAENNPYWHPYNRG